MCFLHYRLPVPIEAAQAILGPAYHKQAKRALRTLINQHLIQDVGGAAYQLHVIIARYAREHFVKGDVQANQQALQEAHIKAGRYYRNLSALHCPPPERRRIVKEVEPLIEGIWHLTQAGEWQGSYQLAVGEGVFEVLDRCGGYGLLLEWCQIFLASSAWQRQPTITAYLFSWQGKAQRVLGQPQQALICFERALTIRQEVGDRRGQRVLLNSLGMFYHDLGKKTEALQYYEQALAITQEVKDRANEGTVLNNIGMLYHDLGKKTEALQYYDQALTIAKEMGNRANGEKILNNLGILCKELGKRKKALQYYEQALAITQEAGNHVGEGVTSCMIGVIFLELEQYLTALAAFLLAQRLFQQVLSPHQEAAGRWIRRLKLRVGEEQFRGLLAQIEAQPEHVLMQALSEWRVEQGLRFIPKKNPL